MGNNGIHLTARSFALKHRINLGRFGDGWGAYSGYYYIGRRAQGADFLSMQPTAKSALAMLRRYLRSK
jgi:hypothetical protein